MIASFAAVLLSAVAVTNTTPAAVADSFSQLRNPARITSDTTYYDRKEGLVVFKGNVHVDDSEYQLHADRAFIFLSETNSLKRIAATGSVALTNGTKRAYGEKLTYRRDNGLVVLQGGEEHPAMVADATTEGDRTIRGNRIRFWINSEQIEVLDSVITAPKVKTGDAIGALKL